MNNVIPFRSRQEMRADARGSGVSAANRAVSLSLVAFGFFCFGLALLMQAWREAVR